VFDEELNSEIQIDALMSIDFKLNSIQRTSSAKLLRRPRPYWAKV